VAALAAIAARVPGLRRAFRLCNAPATARELIAWRTAPDLTLAFRPAKPVRELRPANERLPWKPAPPADREIADLPPK
jgi:hypothetical protein